MFCKKCGKEISEKDNFCAYCGEKNEKEEIKIEEVEDPNIELDLNKKDGVEDKDIFAIEEQEELEDMKEIEEMEELPEELDADELFAEKAYTENTNEEIELTRKKDETFEESCWKKEEIISVIFGGMAFVLSFFISVFSLPFSISGLIFAEYSKDRYGKIFAKGKLINWTAIVVAIMMFFISIVGFISLLNATYKTASSDFSKNLNNYQYNVGKNYNRFEDVSAEEDWQKAQDMLNKQKEQAEQKKKQEKVNKDNARNKYTDIGFMEYSIPEDWTFNGIRNMGGERASNIFSKGDAFLAVKSIDLTGYNFSKETLAEEVSSMYGGIENQGSFTTNENGLLWDMINTPTYIEQDIEYTNSIYYHVSDDGNKLLYFEVYIPNTMDKETINTQMDEILNSVKEF